MNEQEDARRYLRERGVLEETFTAHGGEIDAWKVSDTIAQRLNRELASTKRDPSWSDVSAILWIPVHSLNGSVATSWLARPLPSFKGKKFMAPIGSRCEPWIPSETLASKNSGEDLVITEGPIKGMALLQAGALPIALWGVYMATPPKSKPSSSPPPSTKAKPPDWMGMIFGSGSVVGDDEGEERKRESALGEDEAREREEKFKLRDEFSYFKLLRRRVCVCFDADHLNNPQVRQAEIRLAILLYAAGADVFQLCTWKINEGKGIDDYIARKAGCEVEEQRRVLDELKSRAKPFFETLDEHDILAVRKELHNVEMDAAQFHALAKKLAHLLKTTKGALGAYDFEEKETKEEKLPAGAQKVDIPETAEPWSQEVDGAALVEEIIADCKKYVWMKPSEYQAVSLMLVMSYLSDVVEILPIFLVTSPEPECGKSTLAEWFSNLSNKPINCSNISPAAVYRVIQDKCPTLVLDEMDRLLDADEVLRSVFNSGHKRKFAFVIRMTGKNLDISARFSTWCPKVLAMIKLPPRTIISRSVHIRLTRKGADVKTTKLRAKHYDESQDMRRKIARFANQIRDKVRVFRTPDNAGMVNRASDNWEPLLGIAREISEDCYSRALDAAKKMSSKDAKEMKSFGVQILECIERIIAPILVGPEKFSGDSL
jgi:Domain of unknown function (DUF3854)/Protein of unknown function (DUF3631)